VTGGYACSQPTRHDFYIGTAENRCFSSNWLFAPPLHGGAVPAGGSRTPQGTLQSRKFTATSLDGLCPARLGWDRRSPVIQSEQIEPTRAGHLPQLLASRPRLPLLHERGRKLEQMRQAAEKDSTQLHATPQQSSPRSRAGHKQGSLCRRRPRGGESVFRIDDAKATIAGVILVRG